VEMRGGKNGFGHGDNSYGLDSSYGGQVCQV
jgi:hypothetical protein